MLSDKQNVSLINSDCSLFTSKILVAEPNYQFFQWNMEKELAQHNYIETSAKTFIIPSRQNQFILENIFSNAPIKRIANAMNRSSVVAAGLFMKILSTIINFI